MPKKRLKRLSLYFASLAVQASLWTAFAAGAWVQPVPVHLTSCAALTCNLSAQTGSGNLIVVGIALGRGINTGTTISSVTDNAGNTFSQVSGARAIDTASGSVIDIWYAQNSIAGATSLTITPSAAVSAAAVIWEFSGVSPSAVVDQVATLISQPATATPSGASVIINSASEIAISLAAGSGTIAGIVSGNPFVSDSPLKSDGWAHLIASSNGTYAAGWTQNPSGTYASSTVSFRVNSSSTLSPRGTATQTSCDVNGDGQVNVVDVQLITNMEIGAAGFACTANVGGVLGCTDAARQVVIKAALGQGCHFVSLAWTASPSAGVVGYNIYRGLSPNGEASTPLNTGGPVAGTSYQDTSTVSGMTYYYFVKATNGSVESPASNESSVTAQ